jgi:hypothetical protein
VSWPSQPDVLNMEALIETQYVTYAAG